jgi:hypothetical protein
LFELLSYALKCDVELPAWQPAHLIAVVQQITAFTPLTAWIEILLWVQSLHSIYLQQAVCLHSYATCADCLLYYRIDTGGGQFDRMMRLLTLFLGWHSSLQLPANTS